MRDRHRMVRQSGVGSTCSTTRSAGTRGRRRLDTGHYELRFVHPMCPRAPAAATGCTEVADEPRLSADPQIQMRSASDSCALVVAIGTAAARRIYVRPSLRTFRPMTARGGPARSRSKCHRGSAMASTCQRESAGIHSSVGKVGAPPNSEIFARARNVICDVPPLVWAAVTARRNRGGARAGAAGRS